MTAYTRDAHRAATRLDSDRPLPLHEPPRSIDAATSRPTRLSATPWHAPVSGTGTDSRGACARCGKPSEWEVTRVGVMVIPAIAGSAHTSKSTEDVCESCRVRDPILGTHVRAAKVPDEATDSKSRPDACPAGRRGER